MTRVASSTLFYLYIRGFALERNVQILVPACNYCVPTKECIVSTEDNPCDIFNSIEFPTDEFFPPQLQQNTTIVQ